MDLGPSELPFEAPGRERMEDQEDCSMCRSEQLPASPRRGEQHRSRLPLPTLYQLTEIIEARSSSWQVGIAMLRGMLGIEGEKASGAGSRSRYMATSSVRLTISPLQVSSYRRLAGKSWIYPPMGF